MVLGIELYQICISSPNTPRHAEKPVLWRIQCWASKPRRVAHLQGSGQRVFKTRKPNVENNNPLTTRNLSRSYLGVASSKRSDFQYHLSANHPLIWFPEWEDGCASHVWHTFVPLWFGCFGPPSLGLTICKVLHSQWMQHHQDLEGFAHTRHVWKLYPSTDLGGDQIKQK